MISKILRAIVRPTKRLVRSQQLRLIDYQVERSINELDRIREARGDLLLLEQYEHYNQVRLAARRMQIERGV